MPGNEPCSCSQRPGFILIEATMRVLTSIQQSMVAFSYVITEEVKLKNPENINLWVTKI
jgi:hypothetical protein